MTIVLIAIAVELLLLGAWFASLLFRETEQDYIRNRVGKEENESALLVDLELPPLAISSRILDPEDFQYVASGAPRIAKLFHKERKTLALSYLKEVRTGISRVHQMHTLAARHLPSLNVLLEAKQAWSYYSLMACINTTIILMYFFGPIRFRGAALGLAESAQLSSQSLKRLLQGMAFSDYEKFKNDWLNASKLKAQQIGNPS